jgi:hypothetical protein
MPTELDLAITATITRLMRMMVPYRYPCRKIWRPASGYRKGPCESFATISICSARRMQIKSFSSTGICG